MKGTMNVLIDYVTAGVLFGVRSAIGLILFVGFAGVVLSACIWSFIFGRPSPLGKEEDAP